MTLWLAKILIYFRNSNLRRTFQISFSVKLRDVPPAAAPFRVTHSPVLFPPRTPPGESGSAPTTRRAQSRKRRPRLSAPDRLFWVLARRCWAGWRKALIVVTPETVVRWHRAGFRLYWTWLSRNRGRVGRKRTSKELRQLIFFQMVAENPTWGAPRIHGELQMLGFDVSERTVSRWARLAPRNPEPAKRWLTFLHNHREVIAAMDFFTVPTFTFGVLYCFFIIAHDRRRILHFNVTRNPTSAWVVQQLREAFPYQSARRFLIFDRDAKFSLEVTAAAQAMGSKPIRTSFRSPWQNGIAERWIGSCRRDLLDHVIV